MYLGIHMPRVTPQESRRLAHCRSDDRSLRLGCSPTAAADCARHPAGVPSVT